ncbi:mitochondrial potassium channel ATP-binding subunit-like [Uloborus diversus]|uniref:mitochondrial potassium channel ATP-binding subunit-like n=1 Tax=Uloborus diversus TaxID=327109 RepID=UPI00240947C5|nr:mitochondrial potassium channel ATP-binding subunit-like [Uloborus diversus]
MMWLLIQRSLHCWKFQKVAPYAYVSSARSGLISFSTWRQNFSTSKRIFKTFQKIFSKKKNLSGKKLKNNSKLFGGLLCSCLLSPLKLSVVHCDSQVLPHTRIVGINSIENLHQEAKFDWKKFLLLVKSEVYYIIFAVVSALVVAYLNIRIPIALGDIVNVVSSFTFDQMYGQDAATFISELRKPAINLIYMYLVQSLFTFAYISTLSVSGERVARNMRRELFSSVIEQDIAFFDAHKTGEISSRLTNDVQEFKSCYKLCISQGLRSIAQTAGCIVSLYLISPKMTGLMVCIVPVIVLTGTFIGRILRQMSKHAQSQIAQASAVADEAIGNIKTVRSFAMEEAEKSLYDSQIDEVRKLNSRLGIGIGLFQGLTNLALNGIVLGVLCVGGTLMCTSEMTPGSMMAFLVATQTIQKSLAHLSLLFGQFIRGLAAGARIFQYMNLSPEIRLRGGCVLEKELKGEVKFNDVYFTYPTRPDQIVLKKFNLTLPRGKMVALCGSSGGGKSTVAALLERFYDVSSGSITIDNIDIKSLDPSWVRGKLIGYIDQEPVLFATTIMENIRYGKPDASDEEVIEAAKMANAHGFISQFVDGYDTMLGERGATVSGGQKQRIAIARALLKDPKILILDEATSALDVESEKVVQEALDYAVKGRTVLVIAHRLSTIQNADYITVITNGVVSEIGNHATLFNKKGLYWNLIKKQQVENEDNSSIEN